MDPLIRRGIFLITLTLCSDYKWYIHIYFHQKYLVLNRVLYTVLSIQQVLERHEFYRDKNLFVLLEISPWYATGTIQEYI